MRLWRVVLLVNLALALGLMLGYLAWGRETARLGQELERARQQQIVAGVERTWHSRAVVRAVLPELNVVVLTHEDLAGYMGSMTMGFRVHDPKLYEGLDIGDTVRFTLRGAPPNVEIIAIAKEAEAR
jgi:Cu/Ag efflux protein CusF